MHGGQCHRDFCLGLVCRHTRQGSVSAATYSCPGRLVRCHRPAAPPFFRTGRLPVITQVGPEDRRRSSDGSSDPLGGCMRNSSGGGIGSMCIRRRRLPY